jgi:hypothetical protein
MPFGQCKDVTLKFVNKTGVTLTIPSEGHRVRNRGALEGWNKLELGGSVIDLAADESESVRQDLSIKCVDDVDIQIVFVTSTGDFTQVFENRDIGDKNAVLNLTNH